MVPSTFIWSKRVKPSALSKPKHLHLQNETSTCNFIIPSQTSHTVQHNIRCSSHTNFSTHCPFTFCKSVRYSCTACPPYSYIDYFFEKKNDRKRKKAGMNSSSPPNPQYPYPPHHTHHLHPPTPTLTTSATFSPQHQQPLRLSSVFPLHDSATSPSVPRLKYHPSHSNSHVK